MTPRDDHPTLPIGTTTKTPPTILAPGRVTALRVAGLIAAAGLMTLLLLAGLALTGDPMAHGRIAIPTSILTGGALIAAGILRARRSINRRFAAMTNKIMALEETLRIAEVRLDATIRTEVRQLRQLLAGIEEMFGELPDRMDAYAEDRVTDAAAEAAWAAHRATGTDGRHPRGVAPVTSLRSIDPN